MRGVHKEELIALHRILIDIMEYMLLMNSESDFSEYNSLGITPLQVHRSKIEHKYAVFVLGSEIAEAMREMESPAVDRISARMHELAEKTLKEIECGA